MPKQYYCESCEDILNDECNTVNGTVKCDGCYEREHLSEKQARDIFSGYLDAKLTGIDPNDVPALNEAFGGFTDNLCRDGLISSELYHSMDGWK